MTTELDYVKWMQFLGTANFHDPHSVIKACEAFIQHEENEKNKIFMEVPYTC